MIAITDLHGKVVFINAELIESIESNPDTQVVLTNGHRYYAQEGPEEIAARVLEYKRSCTSNELQLPADEVEDK